MEETVIYKGIEIEIKRDDYAGNPWESWDCCAPLIANCPDWFRKNSTDYSKGDILDHIKSKFTTGIIRKHMKALKEIFTHYDYDWDISQGLTMTDIMENLLNDVDDSDFETLEALCDIVKIPYLNTSSSGYSQGDYAELFFCWTPEFEKATGCDIKDAQEIFEGGRELFSAWAWGDVYGYNIEEVGDSCWGFYGDDHEKSGLLENAKDAIDCHLAKKEKERVKKLKTMIRNRVPYQYRIFI